MDVPDVWSDDLVEAFKREGQYLEAVQRAVEAERALDPAYYDETGEVVAATGRPRYTSWAIAAGDLTIFEFARALCHHEGWPLSTRTIAAIRRQVLKYELFALLPVECATCARHFTPKRSTARYCSSACRQKAYRRRATDR